MTTAAEVETAAAPIHAESWNDRISRFLPRDRLPEEVQRMISNALFFVIVLQSVPSAVFAMNVFSSGRSGGFVVWALAMQIFVSCCWVTYGAFVARNALIVCGSSLLAAMNTVLLVAVIRARGKEADDDRQK